MRNLLPLLFLPLLSACQRNTAGVTIQPQQVFVLGEYMDDDYRAELRNEGPQAVEIQLVETRSRKLDRKFSLPSGGERTVRVAGSQEVRLYNSDQRKAKVTVIMNKGVAGMRSEMIDGSPTDRFAEDPPASEAGEIPVRTDAGPARRKVVREIPAGSQLIVGEGSRMQYSVRIKVSGGMIEVSGRDKRSGRQLQGFGLRGKDRVTIRPQEDLYLINTSQQPIRVALDFDRPVSGARMTER